MPSLDIFGNVVPFISGVDKIAPETQKLLGTLHQGTITIPDYPVEATCTRVPTLNGHMASVTVKISKTIEY